MLFYTSYDDMMISSNLTIQKLSAQNDLFSVG